VEYLDKLFRRNNKSLKPSSDASQKLGQWWVKNKNVSDFDWNNKVKRIGPFLKAIDEDGSIGNVVLDVGAGPRPLSGLLKKEGRKLFAIDFVRPLKSHDFEHIRGDVRNASHPDSFALKRALVTIADKLGIDPRTADPKQADTIIFSDIMNYVPYEETVRSFSKYLKRGGLIIVLNQPGRTFHGGDHLLDPAGVQNTPEMMDKLQKIGFRILASVPIAETTSHGKDRFVPVRELKGEGVDKERFMIFAVFRKENLIERTINTLKEGGLQEMSDKDN